MKKTAAVALVVGLLILFLCGTTMATEKPAGGDVSPARLKAALLNVSENLVRVASNNNPVKKKKFFEDVNGEPSDDKEESDKNDGDKEKKEEPKKQKPAPKKPAAAPEKKPKAEPKKEQVKAKPKAEPKKEQVKAKPKAEPKKEQVKAKPKAEPRKVAVITAANSEASSGVNVSKITSLGKAKPVSGDNKTVNNTDKQPQPKTVKPPTLAERKKMAAKDDREEGTPRISAIEVQGNENVSTEEIMKAIRSKVGDPLLVPRVRSDTQAIFEMGYFTDVKVDTPYYAGGYKLVFRVQENPVVSKITILGNKIVKTNRLQELMQTTEGKILNMKVLNADINEINYYYDETLGYMLKPTHIKNVNWTPSGELILTIAEGMVIKDIKVTGSSLFKEKKLMSMVNSKKGELFNTNAIKKDTSNISKYYEEEGYILDTVRPQVNYRDGQITIQVVEAVVEDIRLEFTKKKHKTKDYVVMRNIRTQKGKVLQRKKLQRDIERLNNLGYFSKVNVEPEPGSKPGHTILVFKLKEQKTGLATIGVGYSGGGSGALRSGITGAISYQERNLGGTGQGGNVSWQRGVNIDALSASYSNPAINKNQDSIAVTLFRHNYLELRQSIANDVGDSRYALYDDKRHGGIFTYGRRINDDFRLFTSYRKEVLEITRSANSDYDPIGISKGTLNAASLGALYDTRNDVFDPVDGWFLDADYTYGGKALGGDYDFNKVTGEIRKYIPIGRKQRSTIALRAWGGSVSGNSAPITETFYVGGTDSIRGYNENQFYGTRMVVLNAEYRFPLANIKFLKGAVFGDAGNAWFPSTGRKRLYSDYGAGLRIVFPTLGLGVIRLDYARGEEGGRTSIGIGQTF